MGGGEKSLFCPVGVAALSKPFIRSSERGGRGGGGILTPLVFRRRKRVSPPLCLPLVPSAQLLPKLLVPAQQWYTVTASYPLSERLP